MGGRGRPSSSRLAGYSGVPSPWRARAEEWAARGGGERAAPGGSAVAGESRGRASASGVAPTDAVTPSPLSAPACMRIGLHGALCWRDVLARSLARSVAQVPRPWPIPEPVCPAEPRSARHGRRYGTCRPYSPRFAPVRVIHGLSVQFSIYPSIYLSVHPAARTADEPRRVFRVQRAHLLGARRARRTRRAARDQPVLVVLKHVDPLPSVAVRQSWLAHACLS